MTPNEPNTRTLKVGSYTVTAAEFTRRQIKGLDADPLFDWIADNIILSVQDGAGDTYHIDDLPFSDCQAIVAATLEFDPKRRPGSQR